VRHKRRIAITGATGFLGRNLLFEVVRQNLSRLDTLEILVLGRRSKDGGSLPERIRGILASDEFESLRLSREAQELLLSRVIKYIGLDFCSGESRIAAAELKQLQSSPIDWFFHLAGLTDLRTTPFAEAALQRINVEGTKLLLQLASQLQIREFCYVSTAYVCGHNTGTIPPDCMNASQGFRNPYERTKFAAELLVREFAGRTGTRCRYFRPSVICGRLIEKPWGAVSKFEVFYSWPAFFLRMGRKLAEPGSPPHSCELKVRIRYDRRGGLNIVPVDYVAKVMYLVCDQEDTGSSYHLVNELDAPHERYIPQMLEAIGVTGVTHVDRAPSNKNALEKLYYRSVGAIYTPYLTSGPMAFETTNLKPLLDRAGLECPPVNQKALASLMAYATERDFGLSLSPTDPIRGKAIRSLALPAGELECTLRQTQ
jgi:nucleoside-diphosphate-sugar epimerase